VGTKRDFLEEEDLKFDGKGSVLCLEKKELERVMGERDRKREKKLTEKVEDKVNGFRLRCCTCKGKSFRFWMKKRTRALISRRVILLD